MDSDTNSAAFGVSIGAAVLALIGVASLCVKRLRRCHSACCDADMTTPPPTRQPTQAPEESASLLRAVAEAVVRSRAASDAPPPMIVLNGGDGIPSRA